MVSSLCAEIYSPDTPKDKYFAEDSDVARAFKICVDAAAESDVVVSYLPEASMGSAVEIHAAHQARKTIIAIAPGRMSENWVVRAYADYKLSSLDELQELLKEHVG